MTEHSNVAYQVMWNRLISVVEEQAQAVPHDLIRDI